MTKVRNHVGRIFSLILSLTMMIALFLPTLISTKALAAGTESPYTITINPNSNTLTPTGENATNTALRTRFKAYAIFTGELNTSEEGGYNDSTATAPNANQLANIKWGKGITNNDTNYSALLAALCNSNKNLNANDLGIATIPGDFTKYNNEDGGFTVDAETTLGAIFKRALEMNGYIVSGEAGSVTGVTAPTDGSLADSAAVVAAVISDLNALGGSGANNSTLANAFAEIVAEKDTTTNAYKYLSNAAADSTSSKWYDPAGTDENDKGHWAIEGLTDPGYYLVVDTYDGDPDEDEISKYMIAVFGTQTVQIKSNAATSDKWIIDENGDTVKGDDAGIGDTVKFRLTGTLSENFANYKTYIYKFHDTMSKGLTYTNNLKVYAVQKTKDNGEDVIVKYEIALDSNTTTPTGDGYTVTSVVSTDGTTKLTISFADLKKLKGKKIDEATGEPEGGSIELPMDNTWTIEVEYTAEVNKDAVVAELTKTGEDEYKYSTANTNTVKLEYSNNVENSESTGETPEETVYVYVFGLDADKVNGAETDPDKDALPGAGFALTKDVTVKNGEEETTTTYYAVFTKDETTGEYTVVDWITSDEVKKIANFPGIGTWKDSVKGSDLNTAVEGTDRFTATGDYYLAVTTVDTDNGKKLKIKGLDEGTYTLIEKFTPTGYDTMDDIEFTITAEIDKSTGELKGLTASTSEERDDVEFTSEPEGKMDGYIPVTLRNMPAGYLPGTGGLGTVMFYVGGILMLCIGAFLVLRRKANKAAA